MGWVGTLDFWRPEKRVKPCAESPTDSKGGSLGCAENDIHIYRLYILYTWLYLLYNLLVQDVCSSSGFSMHLSSMPLDVHFAVRVALRKTITRLVAVWDQRHGWFNWSHRGVEDWRYFVDEDWKVYLGKGWMVVKHRVGSHSFVIITNLKKQRNSWKQQYVVCRL